MPDYTVAERIAAREDPEYSAEDVANATADYTIAENIATPVGDRVRSGSQRAAMAALLTARVAKETARVAKETA